MMNMAAAAHGGMFWAGGLVAIMVSLAVMALFFLVLYFVVRRAVRDALNDHRVSRRGDDGGYYDGRRQ